MFKTKLKIPVRLLFLPSIQGPGHAIEGNETWLMVSLEVFLFPQNATLSATCPDRLKKSCCF